MQPSPVAVARGREAEADSPSPQVDTLCLEDLHAFLAQALCLQGKSAGQLADLQVLTHSPALVLGAAARALPDQRCYGGAGADGSPAWCSSRAEAGPGSEGPVGGLVYCMSLGHVSRSYRPQLL